MPAKTAHVIPREVGWAVVMAAGKPMNENELDVYPKQKEAIDVARKIVRRAAAGQVVVHGRNGSLRWLDVHGMPERPKLPFKSSIGTKAIQRAMSALVIKRLLGK
jgi:hypothetical protein